MQCFIITLRRIEQAYEVFSGAVLFVLVWLSEPLYYNSVDDIVIFAHLDISCSTLLIHFNLTYAPSTN